jgi:ADP-ribose pyrophosphatase YjhB (NUDIX family)
MPNHMSLAPGQTLRHFTVAVFVVHLGAVLLLYHRKLARWLPPGGHVEDNELPDDAARREVHEETGVRACLVGDRGLPIAAPAQLVIPAGIQVEPIYPGHEHIDLVYFAIPDPDDPVAAEIDQRLAASDRVAWYQLADLPDLGVDDEIRNWCQKAIDAVARTC